MPAIYSVNPNPTLMGSNVFSNNLDLILSNPVQIITNFSKSDTLKLIFDYFTDYLKKNEISPDNFKKLVTINSNFLKVYCPKLDNLSYTDQNLNSYFDFLASLQTVAKNLGQPEQNALVLTHLQNNNLNDFKSSCQQLGLTDLSLNPLNLGNNDNHYFNPKFPNKLLTGFTLGAAAGAAESLISIILHIMERYKFSNTAISTTKTILVILSSINISILPFAFIFIKNLTEAEAENKLFDLESIYFTSLYTFLATFSFQIIKNMLLTSEHGKIYLKNHFAFKFLINNLPLLGCLFIVAKTNENLLERLSIALMSCIGALIPSIATQFALSFSPNKIEEKLSNNKSINMSFINGAIAALSAVMPKFPISASSDNSVPTELASIATPNNVQTLVESNSAVISSDESQNMPVKHSYLAWQDQLAGPSNSSIFSPITSSVVTENKLIENAKKSDASTQTEDLIDARQASPKLFKNVKIPKIIITTPTVKQFIKQSPLFLETPKP